MKKIVLLFIFSFLFIAINGQPLKLKGTLDGIYKFKTDNCSKSYLFQQSGAFYVEGGCESGSSIAKGTYIVTNNKIVLKYTASEIRYSIIKHKNKVNDYISVAIIDTNKKPLSYFKIYTLPNSIILDTINEIDVLQADVNGEVQINPKKISAISFDRIDISKHNAIQKKVLNWEKLNNLQANNVTIKFNYPLFCLQYSEIATTSFRDEHLVIKNKFQLADKENNIYVKSNK